MAHSSPYGPAGGDLQGTFPNPTIRGDSAGLVLASNVFGRRSPSSSSSSSAAGTHYLLPMTDGNVAAPQIIFYEGDLVTTIEATF